MSDADAREEVWTEAASAKFIDMADVYVPMREEQVRTLVDLIPARADESFTVVELGAGGGALAGAVLAAFPQCHYVALDGSEVMRQRLGEVLSAYSDRVEIADFELADSEDLFRRFSALREQIRPFVNA